MTELVFPEGMDSATFLSRYWQKTPLLMKAALPGFHSPLDADELAGLACEPEVESRLVLERGGESPWEVRYGPFDEEAFRRLGKSHWSLLVQDVDKHEPAVAELLEYFRFIADWRVDDVMVGYAADQGSVGPHIDDYDVFLYQANGRRRWQIMDRPRSVRDFIPGLDLRILPEFHPDREWLLEPGDMLYLPPRIAHWGVALGECMTCSVGFRAPTHRDLVSAWCDEMIETRVPEGRYRDPEALPPAPSAEIQPQVIARVQKLLEHCATLEPDALRSWFGRYISESKPHLSIAPPDPKLDPSEFLANFEIRGRLLLHGYARPLFARGEREQDFLFADGSEFSLTKRHGEFLPAITRHRALDYSTCREWLDKPDCVILLTDLYNRGIYEFGDS